MKKYHYATVSMSALCALARVPKPKDSYTADDEQSRTIAGLINSGYRLVANAKDEFGDYAIFEREFDGLSPKVAAALGHAYEPLAVLRELLEAREDEYDQKVCDCRPEPENDGHVCAYCKARSLLGMFRPPHPEQLPQGEDPRATTTLPED